ncbi:hypothetical protein LCGC14_1291010 [marine sediment metagenome]|uniref:DNA (cytosine-5-)-methyltransferase n=1 Tax=marine sediment metagenome TaxID=412755 RepID=A0A0F9KSI4_9ZZZZ
MSRGMTYATVCSGIGAPEIAWNELWGPPLFTSEIEPFPSAVLKHHMPEVPNYGDMTKYKEWPDHEQLRLICGGTPCQSFSVAGLRKGMDDPRGNLTLTFLGLLARYNPRWFVWENVPGVFSSVSNGGSDLGRFLAALAELGYSCAYRVLDAQHFGVPQRRRRVFVVGHFGNDWRPPFAVLFEPESLRGNIKKSHEKGEGVARCLKGKSNLSHREDSDTLIAFCQNQAGDVLTNDKMHSLATNQNATGRNAPLIMEAPILAFKIRCGCGGGGKGYLGSEDKAFTVSTSHDQDIFIGPRPINTQAVACIGGLHPNAAIGKDIAPTLPSAMGMGGGHTPVVGQSTIVRRLTPMECERLQGFPDGYTLIPWRKGQAPDGPRYKALGNSMAVPVVKWIGRRIQMWETLND